VRREERGEEEERKKDGTRGIRGRGLHSETRSCKFDSASVNSISSIPSPVYCTGQMTDRESKAKPKRVSDHSCFLTTRPAIAARPRSLSPSQGVKGEGEEGKEPHPMQERLPPEHRRELIPDPLEELLDARRVPDEGDGHLEPSGRDVAVSGLDVVRDPLDKVGRVLGLDVLHLLLDLFHGDLASEVGGDLTIGGGGGRTVCLYYKEERKRERERDEQ
jgi:hypothetical protein